MDNLDQTLKMKQQMDWNFGGWTPLSESARSFLSPSSLTDPLSEESSSYSTSLMSLPSSAPSFSLLSSSPSRGFRFLDFNQSPSPSSPSSYSYAPDSAPSPSSSSSNNRFIGLSRNNNNNNNDHYNLDQGSNQPGMGGYRNQPLTGIPSYNNQQQQNNYQQQQQGYHHNQPQQQQQHQGMSLKSYGSNALMSNLNPNPTISSPYNIMHQQIRSNHHNKGGSIKVEPKPFREAQQDAYKVIEQLEANGDLPLNEIAAKHLSPSSSSSPSYSGSGSSYNPSSPPHQPPPATSYPSSSSGSQPPAPSSYSSASGYNEFNSQSARDQGSYFQQPNYDQPSSNNHQQMQYGASPSRYQMPTNNIPSSQDYYSMFSSSPSYSSPSSSPPIVGKQMNTLQYAQQHSYESSGKHIGLPVKEVGKDYFILPVAVETDEDKVLSQLDINEIEKEVLRAIPDTLSKYADQIPDHLYGQGVSLEEAMEGPAPNGNEATGPAYSFTSASGPFSPSSSSNPFNHPPSSPYSNQDAGSSQWGGFSSYLPNVMSMSMPSLPKMPSFISAFSPSRGKISDILRPLLRKVRPPVHAPPVAPPSPAQQLKGNNYNSDIPVIPGGAPYSGSHRPDNLDIIHLIANQQQGGHKTYHVNQLFGLSPSASEVDHIQSGSSPVNDNLKYSLVSAPYSSGSSPVVPTVAGSGSQQESSNFPFTSSSTSISSSSSSSSSASSSSSSNGTHQLASASSDRVATLVASPSSSSPQSSLSSHTVASGSVAPVAAPASSSSPSSPASPSASSSPSSSSLSSSD